MSLHGGLTRIVIVLYNIMAITKPFYNYRTHNAYNRMEMCICTVTEVHIFLGEQSCLNNPDVNQPGNVPISLGRQVIIPNARFNCTAQIIGIAVSLSFGNLGNNPPLIQLWRPSTLGSSIFNRIAQVEIPPGDVIAFNHLFVNMSITSSNIEALPGDVLGYYLSSNSTRRIGSIQTSGYTAYSNNANISATTIDISDVDNVEPNQQPLIELSFGKGSLHVIMKVEKSSWMH